MAQRAHRRKVAAKGQRLNTSFAAPAEAALVVPVRWVKFVVGLFLLPLCYILTAAFFSAFSMR
jgi:hypothetical protein